MARRFARFERVEAILPKMVKNMGIGPEFKARMVLFYWPKIVGHDIAGHVRPVRVSFHTLFLWAENPSWANQLMLMRLEIVDKVNHFMGERIIHEIRFGPPPDKKPVQAAAKNEEMLLVKEIRRQVLSPAAEEKVAERCAGVADDELRERLAKVYRKQLCAQQAKEKQQWHPCAGCGVLCPKENELCSACARQARQQTADKIQEILAAMPWARYRDIYAVVKCTPEMVNYQRMLLLQRLVAKLAPGDHESLDARMLVMLYRSLPPEQLTAEIMEQTLHRLRYDIDPNLYRREYKKRSAGSGREYGKNYQKKYQKNYRRRSAQHPD